MPLSGSPTRPVYETPERRRVASSPAERTLHELADDELVMRYRQGEGAALDTLLHRYRRFARVKARGYFLVGGDRDDIEQEGLIGLFKAVRDYRPDREASFRAFAELCITRQVITAIKTATRQKHQPLNRYTSISSAGSGDTDHESSVEALLDDHHVTDPAEEVIAKERYSDMRTSMEALLSRLEVDVLGLYVEGASYQEIGDTLGRHVKSIDNALQRIKRKVETQLDPPAFPS
jgi:RNA polymerase sporulation-specific sigma factor